MSRATAAILATAAVAAAAGVTAGPGRAAPPPCERDVICAVVRETARSGWPHPTTPAEIVGVMRRVQRAVAGPLRSGVACWTPRGYIGRTRCAVVIPAQRGQRERVTVQVAVRVWEDGSWRGTQLLRVGARAR